MTDDGRFGSIDGGALVIASVVGAGIFAVPSYVASQAGAAVPIMLMWLGGGLLAMAGALCYAELAMRFKRGGAEYIYLREAYGELAGYLSGWTSFIAGFSGAIAVAAVAFAAHLTDVAPALHAAGNTVFKAGPMTITFSPTTIIAAAIIIFFTLVCVAGIRASRIATNGLVFLIVTGLLVLIAGGALVTPARENVSAPAGIGAMSALVPIFFTYSGWNAAAYVAGEFRDPVRNIPRALIGGSLMVTLLYVGINASLVRTLSVQGLATSQTPVAAAADEVFGPAGAAVTTLLILVALASSVCALVITGPRIYSEMARDGALPSLFATSARRSNTPVMSSLAQSGWSIVLVLTGTFAQIVTYTGFAVLVFSGAAVSAVIVMRRRWGRPSSFSAPGYPMLPIVFLACVALIAVSSFLYAPGPSLAGIVLIAAGIPVRALSRRLGSGARIRTAGAVHDVSA